MFHHAKPEAPIRKEKIERSYALKEFEKDLLIASYFGFTPVKTPEIIKDDVSKQRLVKDPLDEFGHNKENEPFVFDTLEKTALLRTFYDWKWDTLPSPVLIAYKKPLTGSEHKKSGNTTIGLDIFGQSNSCAEAILIRTALSILEDEGWGNLSITLNSLGDKESVADFERVIGGYVRKNINVMTADMRKAVKKDIFEIIRLDDPKSEKLQSETPKSMSFLSESSRIHFKEVLEYVESFGLPYSINPKLIGSPTFCSHTVFEIRGGEKQEILLAQGYRYSRLSKKIGFKKELPAIGMTISFKKKEKKSMAKGVPKPKFYLVQLSFGAKMKSLQAIELLRKAKVFVAHSLARDKFQSQMTSAENMRVPYMLIIGQKEAIENCVAVRDMNTRV